MNCYGFFIVLKQIKREYSLINLGIKEQVNTIANRYNKWLYLFHISSC